GGRRGERGAGGASPGPGKTGGRGAPRNRRRPRRRLKRFRRPRASRGGEGYARSARAGATRSAALEPHPDLAVLEVLLLPHRHCLLERVDRVPARLEGVAAVLGRDGDEHARLAALAPSPALA